MWTRTFALFVTVLLDQVRGAEVWALPPEAIEPPIRYTLELDGVAHPLPLGAPVVIRGRYSDPKITLRASPTRQFDAGGIAFEYPASFVWEAEVDNPASRTWTLSGNDLKVIYTSAKAELSVEAYAAILLKKFPHGASKPKPITVHAGAEDLRGLEFGLTMLNLKFKYTAIAFKHASGWGLICFQDAYNGGSGSAEGRDYLPAILKSILITPA